VAFLFSEARKVAGEVLCLPLPDPRSFMIWVEPSHESALAFHVQRLWA